MMVVAGIDCLVVDHFGVAFWLTSKLGGRALITNRASSRRGRNRHARSSRSCCATRPERRRTAETKQHVIGTSFRTPVRTHTLTTGCET